MKRVLPFLSMVLCVIMMMSAHVYCMRPVSLRELKNKKERKYTGDIKKFKIPKGKIVGEFGAMPGWHILRVLEKEKCPLLGKDSKFFKFKIPMWAFYKKYEQLGLKAGVAEAVAGMFTYADIKRGKTPYYVLKKLRRKMGKWERDPTLMGEFFLEKVKKGVFGPKLFKKVTRKKKPGFSIESAIEPVIEPVMEKVVEAGMETVYKFDLKNLHKHINLQILEEIQQEVIKGKAHRYKVHFSIKPKYVMFFVNDFMKLIVEDPRCSCVNKFKVVEKVQEGHLVKKDPVPIFVVYFDLFDPDDRYKMIGPFIQAVHDRYKLVAKEINLGRKPRFNKKIKSFMYIAGGEGYEKEAYKRGVKKGYFKNTVYTLDYVFFKGYEIDPIFLKFFLQNCFS